MSTITLHRFPSRSKLRVKTTTKVCKGCPENGPQALELNPEYIKIANKRLKQKFGMFYQP